ncbi:hypothetical protein K504DRAFT_367257 [Pleomassaria siparia CBS 279.74]|uniref:Rhodopsin domain-containing protein n=1 Tax=Pleomassaria siparia CBS 279.74 TaxID=1314801 RepID=A0A6G1KSM4_9PLEO|nr:hypothetical protein K504DRAFT_367257 [Pleomassaria siparia CBS 279.74]
MAIHDSNSIVSRGETQANVAIAFLILAWIFILLRIWTRTIVISNFGWDDTTMIFAGILFTIYCVTMIIVEANGGGTHITSVEDIIKLTRASCWTMVGEGTYVVTTMMLKISLGIFFARIVVARWQLMTIYVTVAVNICSSLSAFLYALLRCGTNLELYVYKQIENSCTPQVLDRFFAYQQAVFTTLTDLIFITLPIFILWNACMNIRTKLSVGFILCLAALGCVCSLIRFQYVDGLTQVDDFFWNATNIAIWSTIEPGAGIIAGCLATLRPFLKRFVATARSVRSSASNLPKVSRSFRSNENSNARSTTESNARNGELTRSRRGTNTTNADVYASNNRVFELKSDVSKKNESQDFILAKTADVEAMQQEQSLDLERQSISQNGRTT